MDLAAVNKKLHNATATDIIQWTIEQQGRVIASTSFGPNSAVLLHLLAGKNIPIVWVDTGYNLRETYVIAEQLMQLLELPMHIESPAITAERLNVIYGGIPSVDETEKHQEFTQIVKLNPFKKALQTLKPTIWISGLRASDNEYRKNLDIVSYNKSGILKVAPLFYWSDARINDYMSKHQLPTCRNYFDPTKIESGRECGLHTNL